MFHILPGGVPMLQYLRFAIKLLRTKDNFFKYPTEKKARILEKNGLYFEAGKLHLANHSYDKAILCFKRCGAYRHLMYVYAKTGLYSKAIEVADTYHYYKEGAKLSEKINNPKKAAYFYSYFKPLYGAKLYKKQGYFYEAGECYVKAHSFIVAIDCFNCCLDTALKYKGLKNIEEIAITLYFMKAYEEAFQLFAKLEDYDSAAECTNKLNKPSLLRHFIPLKTDYNATTL